MTGKKQKATSPEPPKAMMEPSSVEVPNVTLRSPVVTNRVGDNGAKRKSSRGAS